MSEKPISPLRQRMLDDMNMRRFVPDTQREYIRAVKRLTIFLGCSDCVTGLGHSPPGRAGSSPGHVGTRRLPF
jgi:hypothetical protein